MPAHRAPPAELRRGLCFQVERRRDASRAVPTTSPYPPRLPGRGALNAMNATAMNPYTRLPGTPVPMHRWTGDDGLQLAGDSWGDPRGPLVLLLHGVGQTRHAWRATGQRLGAAGYHAVAFDARGHGDSDWAADGDYSTRRRKSSAARPKTSLRSPETIQFHNSWFPVERRERWHRSCPARAAIEATATSCVQMRGMSINVDVSIIRGLAGGLAAAKRNIASGTHAARDA